MDFKRNIIVTGGAGFIGSHVVRLFVSKYPDYRIVNVDKLTYAGNLENLRDVVARKRVAAESPPLISPPRGQFPLKGGSLFAQISWCVPLGSPHSTSLSPS